MSQKGLVVVAVLILTLAVFGFSSCKAKTPEYDKVEVNASIVKIIDNPNVREEAVLQSRDDSNSLGNVEENGFTIRVNGLLKADIDANNGVYYGFKVEDILAQPEGTWFPSRIEKDSDGVVWINHKYVQILF